MRSISCRIMPLVINSLGRGHTHTNMHTDDPHRINFKKPGALACGRHVPGLKSLMNRDYREFGGKIFGELKSIYDQI